MEVNGKLSAVWRRIRGHSADGLILGAVRARIDAERACLRAILAALPGSTELARDEGVGAAEFGQEDHRLIYCAAVLYRDEPLVEVLALACSALVQAGLWDPYQLPGAMGMRWSERCLWTLADELPSTQLVTVTARDLVRTIANLRDACAYRERQRQLLEEVVTPVGRIPRETWRRLEAVA